MMAGKAYLLAVACVLGLASVCAAADVIITPTSGFPSSLTSLSPGDVVTFQSSTAGGSATFDFSGGDNAFTWTGTITNPIIVRARPGDTIILKQTNNNKNIMEIAGSYFVFKGFEITTDGASGPQLRLVNGASHAIIEDNHFYDFDTNPLTANSGNSHFRNLTFRNNVIEKTGGTGECLYLGQPDGVKAIECKIENNICRDTCSYACGGGSLGSGFQIKSGSYNNIVRDNVCSNTNGVCVLLYDDYDLGANLVEGNVILNVKSDNGIQASAGAVIRNNIIIGTKTSGSHGILVSSNSLMIGSVNRNIAIVHNTIINGVRGVNFASFTSASTGISMINNLFLDNSEYDINVPNWSYFSTVQNNGYNGVITSGSPTGSVVSLGASSSVVATPTGLNVYPVSGSAAIAAGAPNDLAYDFNGYIRDGCTPTLGAYEYSSSTNPGWTVTDGTSFKRRAGPIANCNIGQTCSTTIGCNGGVPSSTGANPPTGGNPPPTGGNPPPTGGNPPPTGGNPPTGTPSAVPSTTPTSGSASTSPLFFGILASLLFALF